MRINQTVPHQNTIQMSEEQRKLKKACCDLEAIFLGYLLKSMRKTVQETNLFGSSSQEQIFRDMLDNEICSLASRTQSLGLGEMLYRQLSKSLDKEPDKPNSSQTAASKTTGADLPKT
jgi:flagellar protein FlgJ